MTPQQTGDVLAKCAAFDLRKVGPVDVLAWHEVIGHLDLADCLGAVTAHYREQRERAMASDIRKLATVARDARDARQRQLAERAAIESAPTIADRSADVTALVLSVVASLPEMDNVQRAQARALRERGRPEPQPARPRKQHTKPMRYPPPADKGVATLATRYLVDGYTAADVSERLGISRKWCEKTAAKFTASAS